MKVSTLDQCIQTRRVDIFHFKTRISFLHIAQCDLLFVLYVITIKLTPRIYMYLFVCEITPRARIIIIYLFCVDIRHIAHMAHISMRIL